MDIAPGQAGTIRQSDLATMFGVSRVTVSRALRHDKGVGAELAEAIVKAARARGYCDDANFYARALRQRRDGSHAVTNVICAIATNAAAEDDSPFHKRLLRGIERGVLKTGDELLVVPTMGEGVRIPRVVVRRQVDGVIWLLSEVELEGGTESCFVPMVSVLYTLPGADVVAVDDKGAMREMGEYLARKGHRRVAFVGPDSELARARLSGLRAGLAGAGGVVADGDVRVQPHVMLASTVLPLVRALMAHRKALPEPDRYTAIAAYNDYIALTVIRCLRDEFGLSVPRDMSVTGFDGLDLDHGADPKLTTAAMPLEDLGTEAVNVIDWRMRNPKEPVRRIQLPAPLVEGETVMPVGEGLSVVGDRLSMVGAR